MNKFFLHTLPALLLGTLVACSSDSSSSQDNASDNSAASAPASTTRSVKVAAFLRGAEADEAAARAFEQGMQIAVNTKSASTPELVVLERSQGAPDSATLQSLTSGQAPVVVYWQTSDIAPAVGAFKDGQALGVPVWNVTKAVARFGSNVFGFGYSTERSFAQFAKFAGNKLKSYRFGIVSSSSAPFDTQSRAFIEETKSQGNTVVFDEKAESTGADFAGLVARATKESCDTIFASLPGTSLVALIKAARSASYAGKILVGDSFYATELASLGKDAEGIYVMQAWSDDATLKAQYAAQFGSEPDGVMLGAAALGYDLIKCIESAGAKADATTIRQSWLSQPCEGLTGKTQFSGERIAQRTKRILTVKDGKFEAVG